LDSIFSHEDIVLVIVLSRPFLVDLRGVLLSNSVQDSDVHVYFGGVLGLSVDLDVVYGIY
jgi:hypothetical protein